jgi:predicted dehydrogenase
MIRVALLGYGHLGKWHADKIMANNDAELVAIVDPSPETVSKLKEKGISTPVYRSLEECNVEFDAGVVVTPTSFHYQICKELLSHNKHVFCEKPMTSTFEQSLEIESLAKERGVVFQVGHSERFHAIWETVKGKDSYFVGKPLFHLERQAPFKGRATDVDVVQDLMIHDLDILLYLIGEMPMSVRAFGKKIRTDKWDYAEAYFEFASGAHAVIKVGRNYVEEVRDFVLTNEAGTIKVDLFKKTFKEARGNAEKDFVQEQSYPARDHLLEEHKVFYSAIKGKTKNYVSATDGRAAVFLVEKVLQAIASGNEEKC